MRIITDPLPTTVVIDEENRLVVQFTQLDELQNWLAEQLESTVMIFGGKQRPARAMKAKATKQPVVKRRRRRRRDEASIQAKRQATLAAKRNARANGESWPGAQAATS